ncbi:hypothetical protein ACFFLS_11500 [Flavobacterium procerum]|uniref:Efflux transporter periplasmic adaptor subunit n=1 Tax=Flavobacterium procerum TaxID=1455569 RepID=A0ABV6BUH4_9FLAO
MAEIKIEKKKPIWPWIVAVLLITALVYYVFLRDDQVQSADKTGIETISVDSTANQP